MDNGIIGVSDGGGCGVMKLAKPLVIACFVWYLCERKVFCWLVGGCFIVVKLK